MKVELCAFADEAADDVKGQIDALMRNNIFKIELRCIDGINVKDLSEQKAREIKRELDAAQVSVWSIGSPIGKSDINGDFDSVIKDLKHILRLCKIFECDKIRVFSFFTSDYAAAQKEVIERLRALVKLASEQSVTLYHENEKDIFGDKALRVEMLLESVNGLCSVFDPANFIQTGETAENMARIRKKAGYFHIKDALRFGEVVPAGEGDGDLDSLVSELNRDAVFTLEPHLTVFGGYAAIDSHEMKNKYVFSSRDEAFDTAVRAVKNILIGNGYRYKKGCFVK